MTTTRITKSELRKLIKQSIVEQVGRRWNRDYEENDEDSNDEYKQCMNCEGSGTLGVGLGSKKCFYCHGTGAVSRYLDEQARDKKNDNKFMEQNKVGKDKGDQRKLGHNQDNYDNEPKFSSRPWNYDNKFTEQAASSEIPLGSKANRPQPGDIYVADNDYHPMFFKVIKPSKSSKYGVVYELAKVAAKAERGVFAPDINSELGSHFHRTFHTGQRAFEIGGDVGVATLWNGRPVKAPGYFRERAEHLKELGNGMPGISSAPKIGDVFVTQDGKFLKVSQKYKSNRTGAESYMLTPIASKPDGKPALSSFTGSPIEATYNPRKKGFEVDNGRVPGFATPYKGNTSFYGEQISRKELQKLIQRVIREQVHGGDFAAWGDDPEQTSSVADKKKPSTKEGNSKYKVGDIFVSSWGYEQTNIDFYKIVAMSKSGGPGVKIVKLGKVWLKQDPGREYEDPVMPDEGKTSEPFAKRVNAEIGVPKIKISNYQTAYLWDGKPAYQTASGYGH